MPDFGRERVKPPRGHSTFKGVDPFSTSPTSNGCLNVITPARAPLSPSLPTRMHGFRLPAAISPGDPEAVRGYPRPSSARLARSGPAGGCDLQLDVDTISASRLVPPVAATGAGGRATGAWDDDGKSLASMSGSTTRPVLLCVVRLPLLVAVSPPPRAPPKKKLSSTFCGIYFGTDCFCVVPWTRRYLQRCTRTSREITVPRMSASTTAHSQLAVSVSDLSSDTRWKS